MTRTRQIGMLIPDGTNQFFSTLAQQFQREFSRHHSVAIVMNSDGSTAREQGYLKMLLEMDVDGLVFISVGDNLHTHQLLADSGVPVVVLDRELPPASNADMLLVDNRSGIREAAKHLSFMGHRHIGFLRGSENTEPGRVRYEAYLEWMTENGNAVANDAVFEGDFMFGSGVRAGQRFLEMRPESRPTAVISSNDLMAIGFMQCILEEGLKIPEEVSIVGYDDIAFASWIFPRLSSVRQDPLKIASQGVEMLIERLDKAELSPSRTMERRIKSIEPRLIERDSSGPAPARPG